MKILMLIPTLQTGGGQKVAIDIAQEDRRFVFVVIGKRVENEFTRAVEAFHKVYYMDKEIGFNARIFFKIHKVLKEEKPDVVHFHLGVSLYGLVPCFFKRKISLVYTFHTIAQNDSDGIIRKLCRLGIKFRKMIPVAITETVKDSIEETYHTSKVALIYNGIDLTRYYSKKNAENGEFEIVSIGQIWKAKNFFFMMDVIKELSKCDKMPRFRLVILGDGPLKKELEAYIKKLEIENVVSLMGEVSNVQDYLARADLFILTSHYEGLSLATLEAMASGLPVISTNVGGMKDIVIDNGALIEPGNVKAFADMVYEFALDSARRVEMGTESLRLVKKYDKNVMREKYLILYEAMKGERNVLLKCK